MGVAVPLLGVAWTRIGLLHPWLESRCVQMCDCFFCRLLQGRGGANGASGQASNQFGAGGVLVAPLMSYKAIGLAGFGFEALTLAVTCLLQGAQGGGGEREIAPEREDDQRRPLPSPLSVSFRLCPEGGGRARWDRLPFRLPASLPPQMYIAMHQVRPTAPSPLAPVSPLFLSGACQGALYKPRQMAPVPLPSRRLSGGIGRGGGLGWRGH